MREHIGEIGYILLAILVVGVLILGVGGNTTGSLAGAATNLAQDAVSQISSIFP